MTHLYSIEVLVHYQCGSCARWWTIGDDPAVREIIRPVRTCPWCGVVAGIKEKEGMG